MDNKAQDDAFTLCIVPEKLDLRRQLDIDSSRGDERLEVLRFTEFFSKDAPLCFLAETTISRGTLSSTESRTSETDPTTISQIDQMNVARKRTDTERAVIGSDSSTGSPTQYGDMLQRATLKDLAGHIPNDRTEEIDRRGKEAEAIINGTDRAFSGNFGCQFSEMAADDLGSWPLTASNREEAAAMLRGLERAQGLFSTDLPLLD